MPTTTKRCANCRCGMADANMVITSLASAHEGPNNWTPSRFRQGVFYRKSHQSSLTQMQSFRVPDVTSYGHSCGIV